MLTDTTFWIDLLEERHPAWKKPRPAHAFIAANRARALRVSMITWGELAAGFEHSRDLESVLHGVRVLSLPQHLAWEASRIDRALSGRGGRLGENDNWIAATARAFDRVPGLRVVSY